jgi:DNA-binding MurR/RpiR family transcriptional regulator
MDAGEIQPAAGFAELSSRIVEQRASMPKRLVQVAEYLLSHPDDTALGTTASIARAANVQPSTLVRFAQHMGFDGFSQLQAVFRDRLRLRALSYEERLASIRREADGASAETVMAQGFLDAARKSVESMIAGFDADRFSRAAAILAGAETIYLIGKRRSYPVVAQIAYALSKLGIRCVLVDTANGTDAEIVAMATPADAALACSFAPYAPATVELAGLLGPRGVPLVALTDSAFSPLADMATVWLEVGEHDYGGFRSLSASMALSLAICAAVAARRKRGFA